jgi:hypothetical protein
MSLKGLNLTCITYLSEILENNDFLHFEYYFYIEKRIEIKISD